MLGYEVWKFHGETGTSVIAEDEHDYDMEDVDRMDEMLEAIQAEVTEDPPTIEVEAFFMFLKASKEPLHEHTWKLIGLKSHDYHIITERHLPIMFQGYFDDAVWMVLAELSYFYTQLCAKEIAVEMMEKLENEIPVLLCKMEKIFPPRDFNPMQHLLIHLPYEAKVGSPVQYRWMYHIERTLRYLKPMIGNRVRVEGCIIEAFTLKKVAYFSSVYFTEEHNANAPMMRYNMDEEPPYSDLSIFASRGTTVGSSMRYYSTSKERKTALLYIYANIDGMDKYFK
jgi:hypothetical protein